jgi:hypothetical protein
MPLPLNHVGLFPDSKLITPLAIAGAASTTTPLAPRSPPVGTGSRLIHIDLPAMEFFSIQARNRGSGLILIRHLNETKAPGLATIFIFDDVG